MKAQNWEKDGRQPTMDAGAADSLESSSSETLGGTHLTLAQPPYTRQVNQGMD